MQVYEPYSLNSPITIKADMDALNFNKTMNNICMNSHQLLLAIRYLQFIKDINER